MTIKDFRDLKVWQEAMKLMQGVYIIVKNFPVEEKYNLVKHLMESSRGVCANIAEGFGRYHFKEKLQFYGIARGCLYEVLSDIESAHKFNYINFEMYKRFIGQINLVGKMLNYLISSTAKKLD
jgi:four helix bundle protein